MNGKQQLEFPEVTNGDGLNIRSKISILNRRKH